MSAHIIAARGGLISAPHHCCKGRSHISPTSLLQGTVSCQPTALLEWAVSCQPTALPNVCCSSLSLYHHHCHIHSYVHTSQYHVTPYVNHYHNYITAFTPCQCHPPHSNHLAPLHHTSSPHVITTWITHCVLLFVHWNWM